MSEKRSAKLLAAYAPFPMCVVSSQGKVIKASDKIGEVFKYDGIKDADIFALTGIKMADYVRCADGKKELALERNEKAFRIFASPIGDAAPETADYAIYFLDVTSCEQLKVRYDEEKTCIAIVSVDNVEELSANSSEEVRFSVLSDVDKTIRLWAQKMNASITKYRDAVYLVVLENRAVDKLIEGKFAILDEIREMETESDLPVSLSIGLGVGGKHPLQNDQFASDALDLALGRAGDQAVIKRGDKIEYYGGKLQAVEKGNKVKSRIVAHALRQLIDQSSKVIIMGHAYQDMDSFGSSLGIFRIAAARGKESWILVNSYNETMTDVYNQAKETGNYPFVNNEKALSLADEETLLIVVDTHRPSLVECRELLDKTDRIVVIDHHRKSEEYIENATLAYMESYASSTAELVTEILQYSLEKKTIIKFEAEALLAGITVDTNSFSVKTGVRTFEAASWLRRSGADTTSVKRYFQTDVNHFKAKANSILNARIRDGIAYSVCEGVNEDMQVVNAQAADELLTIRGVRASFVAGRNEREKTVVSARSLGEINVQTIMETFGGGGHMTTAGASVCMSPEEVLLEIEEYFRKKAK